MSELEELEDLKQVAAKGYQDPVFFCRFFLKELFPSEIPWVHRGLLAILTRKTEFLWKYGEIDKIVRNFVVLDERGEVSRSIFRVEDGKLQLVLGRFTLIMMPRGFSKTTIAGVAVPIYDTLYQNYPFTCYISEAGPHAEMQIDNAKRQISSNPRITAVFGDLKPKTTSDEKWRVDFFETVTGIAHTARGRGAQIRGLNHNGKRPAKIIFDDVEDKDSVKTEEQRKKVRNWFYSDVMPALPELDPTATMVGLGTLLHRDALLATLERDPQFTVVKMEVRDRDGDWLWPVNIDEHKYEQKRYSYALAGELEAFNLEYHNNWKDEHTAKFRPEFFQYGEPYAPGGYTNALFLDPAIGDKRRADKRAIAVVGMTARGQFCIQEVWTSRVAAPRECVDKYFELRKKWEVSRSGIESNAFQKAMVHLVREEMFRKKDYHECVSVTHQTSNAERIDGILQPRYASNNIWHRFRQPGLEAELLDFPNAKNDDEATAVAGAIALLDPYAAAAGGDKDLGDDEYEPLEDWRTAP